jgi:hypothetical protein
MKKIKKEEILDLLTIIPRDYPSLDIFHLTQKCEGLCDELSNLAKSQNYQYHLSISDIKYFEYISQNTELKPQKFDFNKNRYNKHAQLYDYVFIQIDLQKIENIDIFYKKLYAISKNAGKVIFIIENNQNIQELEEILIKHNYVAVNPITDTFSNFQILSAQKMHGWGN